MAIQKLKSQTTIKGCRSFTGMVKCLSLFCPKLKKKNGKPYIIKQEKVNSLVWEKKLQNAFEEI